MPPDVFVVALEGGGIARARSDWTRLLLAVGIPSPDTACHDRARKRPRYRRAGVECRIVDLDARRVERWTTTLEIDLPSLFDRALGPEPPAPYP